MGTPYHAAIDSLGNKIEPFGIDNDPLQVVSIVETSQGNAIRISGVTWGMIYTEPGFPLAYPWMNSQELQIQEGDMGDYWPVGDVEIDIPSVPHYEKITSYSRMALK